MTCDGIIYKTGLLTLQCRQGAIPLQFTQANARLSQGRRLQMQMSIARTHPFASELIELAYTSALMPQTLLDHLPRQ